MACAVGAVAVDGKSPSIWDADCREYPGEYWGGHTFDTTIADFSAAYAGFGPDSVAAFRLGYELGRAQAFSVNPAQAGLSAFSGAYDPSRSVGDLSLTLSFTHDVTPSLSLGGFAAAGRQEGEHTAPENSLRFGAGVGYKF